MLFLAFGMPAAPEWIFIGILALVLLGPKKLPELARGIGKALGELQKAKEDFHREISGVPQLPKIEAPSGMEAYKATVFPEPGACEGSLKQETVGTGTHAAEATLQSGVTSPGAISPEKVASRKLRPLILRLQEPTRPSKAS